MGMLIVHAPQTRQAEHWICKNNLNGSGLRKWIELFLFRLCHGWNAHTVNGRTKLEFACKYTDTITQSIVLKCAVCRTQREIRSHSECTHSIPPKSKTSPSPTWSIASSIASSKVCTSGSLLRCHQRRRAGLAAKCNSLEQSYFSIVAHIRL